jgi:hypothetical protein
MSTNNILDLDKAYKYKMAFNLKIYKVKYSNQGVSFFKLSYGFVFIES